MPAPPPRALVVGDEPDLSPTAFKLPRRVLVDRGRFSEARIPRRVWGDDLGGDGRNVESPRHQIDARRATPHQPRDQE